MQYSGFTASIQVSKDEERHWTTFCTVALELAWSAKILPRGCPHKLNLPKNWWELDNHRIPWALPESWRTPRYFGDHRSSWCPANGAACATWSSFQGCAGVFKTIYIILHHFFRILVLFRFKHIQFCTGGSGPNPTGQSVTCPIPGSNRYDKYLPGEHRGGLRLCPSRHFMPFPSISISAYSIHISCKHVWNPSPWGGLSLPLSAE